MTERFGGSAKEAASGLGIRHDHGSQYMSRDFQDEIAWLGAAPFPAFIRAPEGNAPRRRNRPPPTNDNRVPRPRERRSVADGRA